MAVVRFFSLYARAKPTKLSTFSQTMKSTLLPLLHHHRRTFRLPPVVISIHHRRSFCIVTARDSKIGPFEMQSSVDAAGERIVDLIEGLEGVDRLGQIHVIKGMVKAVRVQRNKSLPFRSSVVFIEVNDGSCESDMKCRITYDSVVDLVEPGVIKTGASIWVKGIVVTSEGSEQKVEMEILEFGLVGKSHHSFRIQKKMVSNEFLRPKANGFCAVIRVHDALAHDTYKFFQENGFVWNRRPVIAACSKGEGEYCHVSIWIFRPHEGIDSPADAILRTKKGSQLNGETSAAGLGNSYAMKVRDLLENRKEDTVQFFNTWVEKWITKRLSNVAGNETVMLNDTDAYHFLLKESFEFKRES